LIGFDRTLGMQLPESLKNTMNVRVSCRPGRIIT